VSGAHIAYERALASSSMIKEERILTSPPMSLLYELMVGHIMGTTIYQLNFQHLDSSRSCDRDKGSHCTRDRGSEEQEVGSEVRGGIEMEKRDIPSDNPSSNPAKNHSAS
jgi:hypothetical protein